MKRYILFVVLQFIAITVIAQSGYNYYEWGWGVGASYERGYTNVAKQYNNPAFNLNLIYNYSPYIPVEVEFQKGTLSGGGLTPKQDPYGRKYTNNYMAVLLHADFQIGAGIDYNESWYLNILKNFYLGTGFGFISNSNTVQRTNVIAANGPTSGPDVYVFPGVNSSLDPMVALRAGYEFKIYDSYNQPSMAIDIGYIHTVAFGEGLDGYNDPNSKFKNNALDQYRQITIAFKYFFGTTVSYNKLIRPFQQW